MPAPRQRLLSVNSVGHWKPVIFIASRISAAVPRGQAWVPCGSMTTDGYPRQSPHIFPLHDDKHHATTLRRMRRNFFSFRMNGKIKPILDEWKWWSQTGSNRRPHACKARALPAELWPRCPNAFLQRSGADRVVGLGRLELPTSRLSSARSNQLSYKPEKLTHPPEGHKTTPMNGPAL